MDLSGPLLSVRKLVNQDIDSSSARTRWLTERIASAADDGGAVFRFETTKTQVRV
jgi:hypothetical protein